MRPMYEQALLIHGRPWWALVVGMVIGGIVGALSEWDRARPGGKYLA